MKHWYIPATIIPTISSLLGLITLNVYLFRAVKSGKTNLITNVNTKKIIDHGFKNILI
ncbi:MULTISPECIES: hypothetical protein [Aquimarina]|uniref:hypothetical protein n=1 Tax=Aquimarina TaxID=290174 RepID=UPI00131EF16E|nr:MULTISPECIES: hypothetical protein [Aquimarina]